jgi:putative ABC transport system ATP-binding protein
MQSTDQSSQVKAIDVRKTVIGPGGELVILEQLNLEVKTGEAVAVLGASGSGKSTLLGLLAGLDLMTEGEIQLFGRELSGMDEDQRAALRAGKVGFVFQNFQLLPTLTALENVLLPLELAGMDKARQTALDAIGQVGLAERAEHYPRQLSGGEQQRIAIARAIAAKPRVLFADEPTGNLDRNTGAQIIDLLLALRKESDIALVLVTHDSELAKRCDRRLLLDQGRLESLS